MNIKVKALPFFVQTLTPRLLRLVLFEPLLFLACTTTTTDTTEPVLTETTISPADSPIEVRQVSGPTQIAFYAFSKTIAEATVTCFITGQYIHAEPEKPEPHGLSKNEKDPLRVVRPIDPRQQYSFSVMYTSHLGSNGGYPDNDYHYGLPFDDGRSVRISQASRGPTHLAGSGSEHAVDFELPIGSNVYAAREGKVIAVKDDSNTGGPDLKFRDLSNHIVIKHEDGTYAEYQHLKLHGVLVKPSQQVSKNQRIGYSGNTGSTAGPHLHFCVFYFNDKGKQISVVPEFDTAKGLYLSPRAGDFVCK
jgi:murein DD-endopeptidase MepM/ murein hydrolase activator NlpD